VKDLVDTNVISEIRKGARGNPGVVAWYATVTDEDLCLSVLVLGEIAKGVELKRRRDPAQADLLEAWLDQIKIAFGDRALPVDVTVIEAWGRMAAIRPIPVVDGLLAATAKVHDLTLVTRNEADVADLGARILNPFD
jgi:hypothetical protein